MTVHISLLIKIRNVFFFFLLLISSMNALAEEPILAWNTFMGSIEGDDTGRNVAIDDSGNVYVTGTSYATWGTPVNPHWGGTSQQDFFVAKLSSSGVLQWNTFLGAQDSSDYGYAIALDGLGNVYVAGSSSKTWGTPINPLQIGASETFVAKLNNNGVLQWNTFLGSVGRDVPYGIALDDSGNIYLGGVSSGTWGTPVDPISSDASWDAFVARLDSNGVLQWNTFMGSIGGDTEINGIVLDRSQNVYVTGFSDVSWGLPVNAHTGNEKDAFVAKLDNSGTRQWHTFMGAANVTDDGHGVALDDVGNVYVVGRSSATWGTPVTAFAGIVEAFLAKLNSSGILQWHTFIGAANGNDYGYGVTLDDIGNVYVVGESSATWGMPVNAHGGGADAFVARLDGNGLIQWNSFAGTVGGNDHGYGIAWDGVDSLYVAGKSNVAWGSPIIAYAGSYEAYLAKITQTLLSPPILESPNDNAANISTMPTLSISITSDPDKHDRTEWQISKSDDFSSPIFKSISHQHLTTLQVPHLALVHGTMYYWRARVYDENENNSTWSDVFTFTTMVDLNDQNSNGIPDDLEDADIDVDGDTIPDSLQGDIKSLKTIVGDNQIGISIRNEPIVISTESINSIDPITISDLSRPSQTPLGLFTFRLSISAPGEEVDVTIHFSERAADNMIWYMYNTVDGWSDYSDYATYSQDRMSIVLSLKDGGHGDADGVANGIIVDPGGSGIASFIHGLILDATTNKGIKGAELSIEDTNIIAFDDGNYLMMILPGNYNVSITADGYKTLLESVEVKEAATLVKDFALTPGKSGDEVDNPDVGGTSGGGGSGGGCFILTLFK